MGTSLGRQYFNEFYFTDPPGDAFVEKDTETVIKGDSITLTCGVTELGRPQVDRYIWKLNGKEVTQIRSYNWTIDPVTLETEANISCYAENSVGKGKSDSIMIQVFGESFSKKEEAPFFFF